MAQEELKVKSSCSTDVNAGVSILAPKSRTSCPWKTPVTGAPRELGKEDLYSILSPSLATETPALGAAADEV